MPDLRQAMTLPALARRTSHWAVPPLHCHIKGGATQAQPNFLTFLWPPRNPPTPSRSYRRDARDALATVATSAHRRRPPSHLCTARRPPRRPARPLRPPLSDPPPHRVRSAATP